jgi:hypothetical protein
MTYLSMNYLARYKRVNLQRSSKWPTIRTQHLAKQPSCQACGSTKNLEVHHIIPVHVDKTKELDPTNLITLCENLDVNFCHYIFGHLALSWLKYDPNVIENVQAHLVAILNAKKNQTMSGKTRPGEPITT